MSIAPDWKRDTVLEIEGLMKSFDRLLAVDHVSMTVESGALVGLIGPNGAGKSTTLKMLATLIQPEEGSIRFRGGDISLDLRRYRRQIGYMPEGFSTFRTLTCEEHLGYFGRCYGVHGLDLDARLDGVLRLTGIGSFRDRLTGTLSTGERQRLLLAKTLMNDPDLLILDEPASGLDPRARIEIRSILRELRALGKTIIISSHILADLEEICSHIVLLETGRVVWSGPIDSLPAVTSLDREQITIEVTAEAGARAQELLAALPGVENLAVERSRIRAEIAAGEGNRMLQALIADGIEVLHFSQQRRNLESLFLSLTREEEG